MQAYWKIDILLHEESFNFFFLICGLRDDPGVDDTMAQLGGVG